MNAVDLRNLRILIVDDEADALNALADIFEDQHCLVTTAPSGAAARAALKAQQFDVALLDIRLPDARGTDLLHEIRESNDATRCIMVTASSDAEDAINAINEGASAYIQKPINIDAMKHTILDVVEKYLKSAEERRKLTDLDIIRGIGEASMDLDLDRLLRNVLESAVSGLKADAGAVLKYDETTRTLQGTVQHNLSDRPIDEYVAELGQGLAGRVAGNLRVMDVENNLAAKYREPTYLQRAGIASAIGVPISSPRGIMGVLVLAWRTTHAFSTQDRQLMSVIAQRVGLAATNARLYALEDESKRRAQYFAKVSQELNSRIEDVQKVVRRVTRLATEWLGDGCAIFLLHRDTKALYAAGSYHLVPKKKHTIERHLRKHPEGVGDGIISQAFRSHKSMFASDEELREAHPDSHYRERVGIASSLAVPLQSHGDVFGVMSCFISESDTRHSASQIAVAEEFADRAAVAIENAMLLRDAKRKREELQVLFGLTRAISSTLQEAKVIHALLRGTMKLMDVPACCIATCASAGDIAAVSRETGMSHEAVTEMAAITLNAWPRMLLASEKPFLMEDLQHCGDTMVSEAARRLQFSTMTSVALDVEGARDHVLFAFGGEGSAPLADKRQLIATLGGLASVALTNARSYKRELTIAERVQQWILSTEFGEPLGTMEAIEIATGYHAALVEASVGGDFYDIFPVSEGLIGIVIGDVSGKGLDAALQTQAAKHTLRAYALEAGSPADVLRRTNDAVCCMLPDEVFITLFYGILDLGTHTLNWANAGHDAPLICHSDLSVMALESSGRALGLLSSAEYEEFQTPLHSGDTVLMYTDGLTEARQSGHFLEIEGVAEILTRLANRPAREVVQLVYDEAQAYTAGHLHDDIALLVLKVL